ncbi:MAG: glycine cleavage system protein GcvH [Chloroflexota bacterium]
MAVVRGCDLPEDLYYFIEKHVWARLESDGLVRIGMTDVAQNLAKTIIVVRPKAVGKTLARTQSAGTVESGKWVGPVPAPVGGEIVEVNGEVIATPSLMNSDPYGKGWLMLIRPSSWESDAAGLATGEVGIAKYREFLEAQGISCES